MFTPHRRSSRLRERSATPAKPVAHASDHLASLTEGIESPSSAQSSIGSMAPSPRAPRTPATASSIKPSLEEMHPSKAHQSTTKQPDSGLRLGFTDIDAAGEGQPSGLNQRTPSKTSTSSFDFRFARPGPQLGPEAQRMMSELREEALRIKAKMAAERHENARNGIEDSTGFSGRKIAKPKGRVGRYSDIHMEEFKKMDSIAGHHSTFRAPLERPPPAKAALKRSPSKAYLDGREDAKSGLHSPDPLPPTRSEVGGPAKRARRGNAEDVSSTRPVSRENKAQLQLPSTPKSRGVFASLITPTQDSLSKAVKGNGTSTQNLPPTRSTSKANVQTTPRRLTKPSTRDAMRGFPRSDSKIFMRSPGKMDRIKSILRYPGSSRKPSVAPSSIPSFARARGAPDVNRALPAIPTTPGGLGRSKPKKHVNFTPDTIDRHAGLAQHSPSPTKSGIRRPASGQYQDATLSARSPASVSKKITKAKPPPTWNHSSINDKTKEVVYPSLDGLLEPVNPGRSIAQPLLPANTNPGTFTFRSDHTIKFGQSPRGFGSSPGQSSIRQVRPSIFSNVMPGSFPSGSEKENADPMPSVAHGMSNKKRRRVDFNDDQNDQADRSPKKPRAEAPEGAMLMAPKFAAEKVVAPSGLPSPGQKKTLSLSRLNMLARPKLRR